MKTTNQNMLKELGQNQIQQLTQEIKETIAVGLDQAKSFSSADLWNIQRMRRVRSGRRMLA